MNKNIKLLSTRAWEVVADEERTRAKQYNPQEAQQRHEALFAELIIRECVSLCRKQPDIYKVKEDREHCAVAIEDHFGL